MRFTLDVELSITREIFRYQLDRTWRKLQDKNLRLQPRDFVYQDYISLLIDREAMKGQGSIKLDGYPLTFAEEGRPIAIKEISGSPHFVSRVHRTEKPRQFTREELVKVIRKGDDSRHNVLVIGLDGKFLLGSQVYMIAARRQDIPVAVRHEMFCADNGYVGPEAAEDQKHINQTYLASLEGWYNHIFTGRLDMFMDRAPRETESELIAKINALAFH